ncbi:MAG: hypothetical protein ACI4J5_05465 [Oscillospiraceae bacterium]
MDFSIVSPVYFNKITDKNNPKSEGLKYTVTVTPAAVEYSFPLMQEEVVRTLIEDSKPMLFQAKKVDEKAAEKYIKQGQELVKKFPQLQHYSSGRSVLMNCIQDRNYSIEKRFLLMNFTIKTIQNMIDQGKDSEVPKFVGSFFNHKDRNDIIDYFKSITPNFAFSCIDAVSMLNSLPETPKFKPVKEKFLERLGYAKDGSDLSSRPFETFKDSYLEMKRWFFESYLKQGMEDSKEYYLENVMIGFIWSMNMPFSDFSKSMWDNFAFFNILFNALKVLLTVYVTEENGDDGFVEAVCALDESLRAVNNGLVRVTISSLDKRGFNTNGDMAVLAMS